MHGYTKSIFLKIVQAIRHRTPFGDLDELHKFSRSTVAISTSFSARSTGTETTDLSVYPASKAGPPTLRLVASLVEDNSKYHGYLTVLV